MKKSFSKRSRKSEESLREVKKHQAIYFESLDAMRKVLTGERLKIVKAIRNNHPASIYELAKILRRDVKNTFDDVPFLAQAGLVELKKTKFDLFGQEGSTEYFRIEQNIRARFCFICVWHRRCVS